MLVRIKALRGDLELLKLSLLLLRVGVEPDRAEARGNQAHDAPKQHEEEHVEREDSLGRLLPTVDDLGLI